MAYPVLHHKPFFQLSLTGAATEENPEVQIESAPYLGVRMVVHENGKSPVK